MNFGIVGTNFISDSFMEQAVLVEGFKAVAVCSGHKENAVKFADKYNIPVVCDSFEDLLARQDIDAVYIATPNVKHKPMAIQCLEAKKPCIVEKPFGCCLDEVKAILKASEENDTYVHDAMVPLYSERMQVLKDEITKIGKIRQATLVMGKYSSRYDAYLRGENPTTFRKDLCNGSIMDLGIYPICVAVALFGKPLNVTASGSFLDTGVDACGNCVLDYGEFQVSILHSKVTTTKITSEILGEKGIVQIKGVSLVTGIKRTMYNGETTEEVSTNIMGTFKDQVADFIKNVEAGNKESSVVPHQLSLDIHDTLTKCRLAMGLKFHVDE